MNSKLYTKENMYYMGYDSSTPFELHCGQGGDLKFAIVSEDNEVTGYIACYINNCTRCASSFGYNSFKYSIINAKAIIEFLYMLIKECNVKHFHWSMVGGNPIRKYYDAFVKAFNGKSVEFDNISADKAGNIYSSVIYHIDIVNPFLFNTEKGLAKLILSNIKKNKPSEHNTIHDYFDYLKDETDGVFVLGIYNDYINNQQYDSNGKRSGAVIFKSDENGILAFPSYKSAIRYMKKYCDDIIGVTNKFSRYGADITVSVVKLNANDLNKIKYPIVLINNNMEKHIADYATGLAILSKSTDFYVRRQDIISNNITSINGNIAYANKFDGSVAIDSRLLLDFGISSIIDNID
jgi:hypothetical protein